MVQWVFSLSFITWKKQKLDQHDRLNVPENLPNNISCIGVNRSTETADYFMVPLTVSKVDNY